MNEIDLTVDVAVVGAGMVGAATACGLAQQGFRVAVIEQREPAMNWPQGTYDLRVSAITRASKNIFQHLHAWPAMQAERVTAYSEMQVWDADSFGHIHFDAAELGEPELGHIIENRVIQRALWQQMQTQESLQLLCPSEIVELDLDSSQPCLKLSDGGLIRAQLLIGADGARSRLRTMADISVQSSAYDQHAVVATLRAESGNQATAWQRFMPTGPLALLPMQQDLFSIVWSTSPGVASNLLDMSELDFAKAVAEASEYRLGEMTLLGDRAVFPLQKQHASSYIRPGLALVGDAAHVIHPLAGQGVNLGLLDAATLVDVLMEAREKGRPLGGLATLRRYERARKGENLAVETAMDGFKRLFSNDRPVLRFIRNLGLGVADRVAPLKNLLARTAMGQGADMPSLARPTSIAD